MRRVVIDQADIRVRNLATSRTFYCAALLPLGLELLRETAGALSFGVPGCDDFGVHAREKPTVGAHIAFASESRAAVDEFFARAIGNGGRPEAAPGIHAEYHAGYYAAFVIDPDGNLIEAVCHNA